MCIFAFAYSLAFINQFKNRYIATLLYYLQANVYVCRWVTGRLFTDVYEPRHLSVDSEGRVLIAHWCNHGILLLISEVQRVRPIWHRLSSQSNTIMLRRTQISTLRCTRYLWWILVVIQQWKWQPARVLRLSFPYTSMPLRPIWTLRWISDQVTNVNPWVVWF